MPRSKLGNELLELLRLERRGAADDREVDHPEAAHRLDRLVRKAALAADRADAVMRAERLRESHHARARRRPDAQRLVLARAELADVRRRVQQEGAAQVERRLVALVEDPDVAAVADADDVAVDGHEVAGAQLANFVFGGWERQAVLGHQNSRSYSISPPAETCTEARRA